MTKPAEWLQHPQLDPTARALASMAWRHVDASVERDLRDAIAKLTALVVLERHTGHSRVHAEQWAGVALPIGDADPETLLPDAATWNRAVEASDWIGDGSSPSPLFRHDDGSIALTRDRRAEVRLARGLVRRLEAPTDLELTPSLVEVFAALFPEAQPVGADLAAAAALRSQVCVITGGPGTGKTTTVVRILALLLAADASRRIAVAAPTGKAAARLQQSMAQQRADLPVDAAIRAAIPTEVRTVHRLLGYRPHDESFRYDATTTLPFDVVVIDEASMLDLGLASALVDALHPQARLILLGDRDQLASVDAGAVLDDLVQARGHDGDLRSNDFARWAQPLFDTAIEVEPAASSWTDAIVELRRNWRFAQQPGIATLAAALRDGDAAAALAALDDSAMPDVRRVPLPPSNADLDPELDRWLDHLHTGPELDDAARLGSVETGLRLLTALRAGPWGVEGLNAAVQRRLAPRGFDLGDEWYPGRPVMIRRNAPALGLANGDVGVCVRAEDGRAFLLVRDVDNAIRRLSVARLPEHETAWAMTVHKSQGSEFDHVLLVLPPGRHPLLTRSLLYTGVTRARRDVTIIADESTLREAIGAVHRRRTGLASLLAGDPPQ